MGTNQSAFVAHTYTIRHAIQKATEHGGFVLSKHEGFISTATRIKCECGVCGRVWNITLQNLLKNRWCLVCGGRNPLTIEDMHKAAKEKGDWTFMSNNYANNATNYMWLCPARLHTLFTTYASFKNLKKCLECEREIKVAEAIEIIKKRDGSIIAVEYDKKDGNRTKIRYKCGNNHKPIFDTTSHIISGRWCKECKINYAEELCRFIFQDLTKDKFINTRKVLNGLELDGYCEKLNLAFEHNGKQHYELGGSFHKTEEDFKAQQKRDSDKAELCRQKGIKLIAIPYNISDDTRELTKFIYEKLKENNIPVIKTPDEITFNDFAPNKEYLQELCKLAKRIDSELLSSSYLGGNVKHDFRCNKHLSNWKGTHYSIKRSNQRCPICIKESHAERMIIQNKDTAKGMVRIIDLITYDVLVFENLEDKKLYERFSHNTVRRALHKDGLIKVKRTHSKYPNPCFVYRIPKSEKMELSIPKTGQELLPHDRLNEFIDIKQEHLKNIEIEKQIRCDRCNSDKYTKGGFNNGDQQYICKNCNRWFVPNKIASVGR